MGVGWGAAGTVISQEVLRKRADKRGLWKVK